MTTDTRDALLPCPFCGGVVEMHHPKGGAYNDITYLLCDSCGAVCSFRPNLKGSKAMAAWNCRTPRPEDARDGARYRWLRVEGPVPGGVYPSLPWVVRIEHDNIPTMRPVHGAALDAAIDAAIAQQSDKRGGA